MVISRKKKELTSDNLYICMSDASQKRKNILYSIKNSLVMQEELDQLMQIRLKKTQVLNTIKRDLLDINKNYQSLKKLFPNVKNIISFTEKELNVLDDQIDRLKENLVVDKGNLSEVKGVAKKLEKTIEIEETVTEEVRSNLVPKPSRDAKQVKAPISVIKKKIAKKVIQPDKKLVSSVSKKLTKLDRIRNNLSVIESKLNDL